MVTTNTFGDVIRQSPTLQQLRTHRLMVETEDLPLDKWERQVLEPVGLPDHVREHIASMARLHREGRYDRATGEVEQITGQPAQTVEQYVASNPDLFY